MQKMNNTEAFWKIICRIFALLAILSIPLSVIGVSALIIIGLPVVYCISLVYKFLTFTFNTLFGGHKATKK